MNEEEKEKEILKKTLSYYQKSPMSEVESEWGSGVNKTETFEEPQREVEQAQTQIKRKDTRTIILAIIAAVITTGAVLILSELFKLN